MTSNDESAVQRDHQRLRMLEQILDLLPIAVYAKDVRNEMRYVLDNRMSKEMFGFPESGVLGKTDADIMSPKLAEAVLQQDLEIVRTAKPYDNPVRLLEISEGESLYFSTRKVLLRDNDGEPSLIVGISENVTDRAETEEALRRSEKKFRELVSNSPVGIFLTDARGACIYVNEKWQKYAGLTNEQAAGRGWLKAVHPDDLNGVKNAWNRFVTGDSDTGSSGSQEFRFVLPDGRVTWVSSKLAASRNEHHQVLGYLGSLTDITGYKQYETELKLSRDEASRANAAKSSFISRMSHELRTPLNAVLGFGQLLQMNNQNLTAKQVEGVQHILAAGDLLLHLIEDVLDFSRVEGGKVSMSIQQVYVDKVVQESVLSYANMAMQFGVKLMARRDSGASVLTDPQCLQQILGHLLTNAIKYNRKNGEVAIAVSTREGGIVRVCVKDTGRGIRPDDEVRLFEPFERVSGAEGQVEGTGIGLNICKKLASLLGGSLGFESEFGVGSTFWVDLPAATSEVDAQAADGQERSGPSFSSVPSGTRFLYVEDNLSSIKLVMEVAQHIEDCRFITATNALEGVALAKSSQPDLILMGMNMLELDGFSALELLRKDDRTRSIPVIAISTAASQDIIQKAHAAGFEKFLTKPLELQSFLGAMADVLAAPLNSESQGKGASVPHQ